MTDSIIGIDCATQPRNTGLSRAVRRGDRYAVVELVVCDEGRCPVEVLAEWIGSTGTALLAIDAPLGWPVSLGRELGRHDAGRPINVPSELLFRRTTDRVVAARTGKTPLDVGADRIARTALAALLLLDGLRRELNESIPLAWDVPLRERVEAIEVYPAATMLTRGGSLRGYKKPHAVARRTELLRLLKASCDADGVDSQAVANDDCLDAFACAVAGLDFLQEEVLKPREPDVARREGWIWFRSADATRVDRGQS